MSVLTSNFLIVSLYHNTKRKKYFEVPFGKQRGFKGSFQTPWLSWMKTAAATIKQNDSPEKFALLTLIISFKFLLHNVTYLYFGFFN